MKRNRIIAIVCAASLMVGIGIGKDIDINWKDNRLDTQGESVVWDWKKPKLVTSSLDNLEECYLCGNGRSSLKNQFCKYDDLGIVCVNNWYGFDVKVRNHDDAGDLTGPQGHSNITFAGTGEDGCFFYANTNSDRGISKVTISCGENSLLDVNFIRKHLCQDCLDKMMQVMKTYGPEDAPWKPKDLCLVDFNTLELYSLQGNYSSYYIGDYYVDIDDSREEELKVTAVYAPVLGKNGKKHGE